MRGAPASGAGAGALGGPSSLTGVSSPGGVGSLAGAGSVAGAGSRAGAGSVAGALDGSAGSGFEAPGSPQAHAYAPITQPRQLRILAWVPLSGTAPGARARRTRARP